MANSGQEEHMSWRDLTHAIMTNSLARLLLVAIISVKLIVYDASGGQTSEKEQQQEDDNIKSVCGA